MDPFLCPLPFSDLNDYILLELFKYLPIKERTRFERIDKRCGQLLQRIWYNQKALLVTTSSSLRKLHANYFYDQLPRYYRHLCQKEGHRVFESDAILLKEETISWGEHHVYRLLTKCPNLVSLKLDKSIRLVAPRFGKKVARVCPKLVHLNTDRANLELFLTYNRPTDGDKGLPLTCLRSHDTLLGLDYRFYKLLSKSQQLRSLDISGNIDVEGLELLLPNLIELKIRVKSLEAAQLYPTLFKSGLNLVRLKLQGHQTDGENVRRICQTMKQLKKVQFISNLVNIAYLSDLVHLEEINWMPNHILDYSYSQNEKDCFSEAIISFLSIRGNQLKSISFRNFPVDYIHFLPQFCPNLEKLNVDIKVGKDAEIVFESISKLKQLTHLSFLTKELNERGIESILNANTGIKQIVLGSCSVQRIEGISRGGKVTFTEALDCFTEYSQQLHPKRSLELILIPSWGRGTPVTLFLQVEGNLRVFAPIDLKSLL